MKPTTTPLKALGLFVSSCLLAALFLLTVTGATWFQSKSGSYGNYATTARLVTVTTYAEAFASTDGPGAGESETHRTRTLQNCGTVPVLYLLLPNGSTNYCSSTNYHGVLAAGSVARDGLGSVVSLGDWRGVVQVAVESGTGVVSTLEVLR